MPICARCGRPANGSFCTECGVPVAPGAVKKPAGWGPWVVGCLALLVLLGSLPLVGVGAWLTWRHFSTPAESAPQRASGDGTPAASGAHRAAAGFRELATKNYFESLERWAEPGVFDRFARLNTELWPYNDETLGWAYFFSGAILCPVEARGDWIPIAYYHPYSDVFLITHWKSATGDEARLVDAEAFMGDFIRRGGARPLAAAPAWMKTDLYRPAALGQTTARTLRHFERAFGTPGAQSEAWRSSVAGAQDEELMADNRVGAALSLLTNAAQLRAYRSNPKPGTELALVRAAVEDFVKARGMVDIPNEEAAARIRSLPELAWSSLRLVAYQREAKQQLVTFCVAAAPNLYLSVLFEVAGRRATLKRADLLNHQAFYQGEGATGGSTP